MGEYIEKWFVKIEARQRNTVCVTPPTHPPTGSEGECSKEAVKLFIWGNSFGSLSPFSPIIWFLVPHLTDPGTLGWGHTHPSAKMDLKVKASGRSKTCSWHSPEF